MSSCWCRFLQKDDKTCAGVYFIAVLRPTSLLRKKGSTALVIFVANLRQLKSALAIRENRTQNLKERNR